jgi:probable HAF family extracellular repeat protein
VTNRFHVYLMLTLSAALGSTAVPEADVRPVRYSIADLGTLGGTESFAYAINDRGDIVGQSRLTGDTSSEGFLYRRTRLTNLAPVNSGHIQTVGPTGINKRGEISCGVISNGLYVPAIYDVHQGSIVTLGSLGSPASSGFSGVATSINDRGQAVGYSYLDGFNRHAFLYSDGEMIDIGSFGGYSLALAISNTGVIVGASSDTVAGYAHAFVYRDGVMSEINPFGGPNNESYALGLNDDGVVVGEGLNATGTAFHGFIFADGLVTDIGTLPGGRNSSAFSINNKGQIVGVADSPFDGICYVRATGVSVPCISYAQRAFLYQDGEMMDLNSLIPSDSGWNLQWAFDINGRGQIVGYGVREGKFRAYLATPVP